VLIRSRGRISGPTMVQDRIVTWANGITLARLLLMPLLVYEVVVGRAWLASFVTLWFVAAMDCLDGYLARKLNQGGYSLITFPNLPAPKLRQSARRKVFHNSTGKDERLLRMPGNPRHGNGPSF